MEKSTKIIIGSVVTLGVAVVLYYVMTAANNAAVAAVPTVAAPTIYTPSTWVPPAVVQNPGSPATSSNSAPTPVGPASISTATALAARQMPTTSISTQDIVAGVINTPQTPATPATPTVPGAPLIPAGLSVAQIISLPVSSYSNLSWAVVDGNNYPLATKMIIDATTSNLANQASLEQQWYNELPAQDPQFGGLFYTAATNMYQQALNQQNKLMTGQQRKVLDATYNATVATGLTADMHGIGYEVGIANAKGISAVMLAQNLIKIYNDIYSGQGQLP